MQNGLSSVPPAGGAKQKLPSHKELPLQRDQCREPKPTGKPAEELKNVIAGKVWNILKSSMKSQLRICTQEREKM